MLFAIGQKYGKEFAMRRAGAKDLERLETWIDGFGGSFAHAEIDAQQVYSTIEPESEQTYREFWEWALVDWTKREQSFLQDENFVRGFIDGVCGVKNHI
jgi:hypothetical protein